MASAGAAIGLYGIYEAARGGLDLYRSWDDLDNFDRAAGVLGLTAPLLAGGLTGRVYGGRNFRIGFFKGARTRLAGDPRVTLYRGVNFRNPRYAEAEHGIARPHWRWWHFTRRATPLEHNTAEEATLRSPYVSWTVSREVANNFASRRHPPGVLLRARIPRSRTVPSPNEAPPVLIDGRWVPEAEVLVRGVVRGARVTRIWE